MIAIQDKYTTAHNPKECFVKQKFTYEEYDHMAKSVVEGEISLAAAERQLAIKYANDIHGPKYFWHAYYHHNVPVPEFVNIRVNTKSQKALEAMKSGKEDTIANVVERLIRASKKVA